MTPEILRLEKARNHAQSALEGVIIVDIPVGTKVQYAGIRGPIEAVVTGHAGEILELDHKVKRHYNKIILI